MMTVMIRQAKLLGALPKIQNRTVESERGDKREWEQEAGGRGRREDRSRVGRWHSAMD
jgi:hypothetical protein